MTETEEEEILKMEMDRRREREALRFFIPNGAQQKFLEAVGTVGVRTIVFPAGNGVGKTASAIAALAGICWPNLAEHEVFTGRVFKNWDSLGYPRRARIISTAKEIEDSGSVQIEISKWFPNGRYKSIRSGPRIANIKTDTGWQIDIMSYDQSRDQFEGATIGLFIFNEPPPKVIYDACAARLRFGGKVLMPLTPLYESSYIKDEIVDKTQTGILRTETIYGDIEDNCKEHGKNGILPHSAIEEMLAGYDSDEIEARAHGKFMHLAGQIYKSFSRDVHVVKGWDLPQDGAIGQIVDPAIGKPLACIWAHIDCSGRITIFREHPEKEFEGSRDMGLTVKEYAELFRNLEGGRPANRILDRHFGNARRTLGGLSLRQEFGEHGIDFEDSYHVGENEPEVETGIMKVKEFLRYNKTKPIDSLNYPRLRITENCINTIHGFERWSRNSKTGAPKDEYKDFPDCVRYLCMSDFVNPSIMKEWVTPEIATYGVR